VHCVLTPHCSSCHACQCCPNVCETVAQHCLWLIYWKNIWKQTDLIVKVGQLEVHHPAFSPLTLIFLITVVRFQHWSLNVGSVAFTCKLDDGCLHSKMLIRALKKIYTSKFVLSLTTDPNRRWANPSPDMPNRVLQPSLVKIQTHFACSTLMTCQNWAGKNNLLYKVDALA